jgi:hypothetical protein
MSAPRHEIVASFGATEWYAVYLAIAERDHQWRIHALYGTLERPVGHSPFRPLSLADFTQRMTATWKTPGGEEAFVRQMLRRAYYYGVDVLAAAQSKQAA